MEALHSIARYWITRGKTGGPLSSQPLLCRLWSMPHTSFPSVNCKWQIEEDTPMHSETFGPALFWKRPFSPLSPTKSFSSFLFQLEVRAHDKESFVLLKSGEHPPPPKDAPLNPSPRVINWFKTRAHLIGATASKLMTGRSFLTYPIVVRLSLFMFFIFRCSCACAYSCAYVCV